MGDEGVKTAILPLANLNSEALRRLITGYTAEAVYQVLAREEGSSLALVVRRQPRAEPYVKRFELPDDETRARYEGLLDNGFCLGAYDGETLAGVVLAEEQAWNNSLWVWEVHIAPEYQRQGLGRALLGALLARAEAAGLRNVVCETQNTNAPAIDFYFKLGFKMEGIDLSYYSNDDYPDGEVGIFMKKRL
jgi:ribosomal protein S18 acetylase RimI-like enzyme